MRRVLGLCLVVIAGLASGAAWAQEEIAREIAREIERKARAKESDEGFCARAAERLEIFGQQHVRARLNEMLSRAESERLTMLFVSEEALPARTCFYLVFQPAAIDGGKKCRATLVFGCMMGRDCRSSADQPICEVRPGVWN